MAESRHKGTEKGFEPKIGAGGGGGKKKGKPEKEIPPPKTKTAENNISGDQKREKRKKKKKRETKHPLFEKMVTRSRRARGKKRKSRVCREKKQNTHFQHRGKRPKPRKEKKKKSKKKKRRPKLSQKGEKKEEKRLPNIGQQRGGKKAAAWGGTGGLCKKTRQYLQKEKKNQSFLKETSFIIAIGRKSRQSKGKEKTIDGKGKTFVAIQRGTLLFLNWEKLEKDTFEKSQKGGEELV